MIAGSWLAVSCSSLNTATSELQPQDLCKCAPLELGIEYRHDEKHVPIPAMTPVEITIDTIYSWPQTVTTNSQDCDVVFEISQTTDKTAERVASR